MSPPKGMDRRFPNDNSEPMHGKGSSKAALRKGPETLIPSQTEMEGVYALWDSLDRFPAEKTDEALVHLAKGLRKLLKADNVKWHAAVRVLPAKRDPLSGWRLRAHYDLVPHPPAYQKLTATIYKGRDRLDPGFLIGLATLAVIAGSGKFRLHRMRDGFIPFAEFRKSEHYRLHYTELGIGDRMWLSFPLNKDTESVFLIDRGPSAPRFSEKEAFLAETCIRGIRGFHRQLFLSRGLLIGETPLSPVSRRIVGKLLTGMSEKEIALSVGQSVSTTHNYIKSIYSQFGVNSRAALMAVWLGA
jgi:DNA-binding CsgD family transcriptional regulator